MAYTPALFASARPWVWIDATMPTERCGSPTVDQFEQYMTKEMKDRRMITDDSGVLAIVME